MCPIASEPELLDHLAALAGRIAGTGRSDCFAGGERTTITSPPVVGARLAGGVRNLLHALSAGASRASSRRSSSSRPSCARSTGWRSPTRRSTTGRTRWSRRSTSPCGPRSASEVLVGATVHPHYLDVLRTYTSGLGLESRWSRSATTASSTGRTVDRDGRGRGRSCLSELLRPARGPRHRVRARPTRPGRCRSR